MASLSSTAVYLGVLGTLVGAVEHAPVEDCDDENECPWKRPCSGVTDDADASDTQDSDPRVPYGLLVALLRPNCTSDGEEEILCRW